MQFSRLITNYISNSDIEMHLGIKKWIRSIQQKEGPTGLLINPVGFSCNHTCSMCWRKTIYKNSSALKKMLRNETKRLFDYEYENVFKQLPWTISSITITGGGEPLLYPEIRKIMSLIKQHRYYGYLITNGSLIDYDLLTFMHEISWDYIRISLHASDKETFAAIHGVDNFSKITSLLYEIQKRKHVDKMFHLKIGLFYAIQNNNFSKLENFYEYAENFSVDEIIFGELMPINPHLSLNQKQIDCVISSLIKISRRKGIKSNAKELIQKYRLIKKRGLEMSILSKKAHPYKRCTLSEIYIDSTGNIYPCCFLTHSQYALGNIGKVTFNHILNSTKYLQIKKRISNGRYMKGCYKYCTLR